MITRADTKNYARQENWANITCQPLVPALIQICLLANLLVKLQNKGHLYEEMNILRIKKLILKTQMERMPQRKVELTIRRVLPSKMKIKIYLMKNNKFNSINILKKVKVRGIGQMKIPQLNAIIASNLATWQKSVQMKQNGKIVYFVAKTPMTLSTVMQKCVLNAIKLAIKQENVRRKKLFSVLSAVLLGTKRIDV